MVKGRNLKFQIHEPALFPNIWGTEIAAVMAASWLWALVLEACNLTLLQLMSSSVDLLWPSES
jgi:hypothetical protein